MNINVESNRRIVVAELQRVGRKSSGIIEETGHVASRVDCTVASLKQGNSIQRKTHSPKSDKKRTKWFFGGLKLSIATDLSQSMVELARKRNVSKVIISETVRNDLGMKSYCRQCRNIFVAKSKTIAKQKAPCFSTNRSIVAEKKFMADEMTNRRNSKIIAYNPSDVPPVVQSKHPASVVVFVAVASDGKVMPVHFIVHFIETKSSDTLQYCLRVNTEEYLKILKEVLISWIKKNDDPKKVIFTYDFVPAHGSKKVQTFLRTKLPHYVPSDI